MKANKHNKEQIIKTSNHKQTKTNLNKLQKNVNKPKISIVINQKNTSKTKT